MSAFGNIPNRVCFDDILMTNNDTEPPIYNEKECPVCYETVPSGVNNCTTDCGHAFCFTCIMKCLENNNTCPICRHILQEEQQYDDSDDDHTDDDDENDDDENDDDENDSNVSGSEPEINCEDYHPANIEYITEVMKEKGFIMQELIGFLCGTLNRGSKNTNKFSRKRENDFYDIMATLDDEAKDQYEESIAMEGEDKRHEIEVPEESVFCSSRYDLYVIVDRCERDWS